MKSMLKVMFIITLAFWPLYAGNIITDIPGSETGSPDAYQQYSKTIKQADGTTNITLLYRIYRYGPSGGQNLPLLVHLHEWGGDFARMEDITSFESSGISFIMLAFQFQESSENERNWWYGSLDGNRTVPWIQNEIIAIIRECMTTNIIQSAVNCTVDTNRIYIYGHSIGGTGAVQICLRHPEIFAAGCESAGWTRYCGHDNAFFSDGRGCLALSFIIGGIDREANGCDIDSSVVIQGNSDQTYLTPGSDYKAFQYTNLGWYFGNYRDPGFESPFIFLGNGTEDNPTAQGDNLQPSLEAQKRGYSYYRCSGEHAAAIGLLNLKFLRNFRKDQSFLAFTNRNYGLNSFTTNGTFNDLETHGWDPDSMVDETGYYHVRLTGTGTSDVTLRRLQHLVHTPGTAYDLTVNGSSLGQIVADEYGCVTIPNVANAASISLTVNNTGSDIRSGKKQTEEIVIRPNPFNPSTVITYSGTTPERARMEIFSINGKLVRILSSGTIMASQSVVWDGKDMQGRQVPAGLYILRLLAGPKTTSMNITLIK